MAQVTVTDTAGATRTITAEPDGSLMEAIRDAGFDDLLAMCGGACACATCHVYVDDPENFAGLPPMAEDEDILLHSSAHRRATSRLSCQLPAAELPEDLHVTIAPGG